LNDRNENGYKSYGKDWPSIKKKLEEKRGKGAREKEKQGPEAEPGNGLEKRGIQFPLVKTKGDEKVGKANSF